MRQDRVGYLDILRSAAICFVVFLHAISSYVTDDALYGSATWIVCIVLNEFCRMGVPLFFMISGFLLLGSSKEETALGFYNKRLPKLIIPLIVWNVIYYLLPISPGGYSLSEFFARFFNNGTSYHMWYIYSMIGIYLIAPFLKKLLINCSAGEAVLLLGVLTWNTTLQPMLNTVTPFYFNLTGSQSAGYLGYFLLGYIVGRYNFSKKWRYAVYALGAVGAFLGIYGNIAMSSREGLHLISNSGFTINHYLAVGALFCFAKYNFANAQNAVSNVFSRHSYNIFWVHALVLTFANQYIALPKAWMQIMVTFVLAMAVSLFVSVVIERGKKLHIK